MFYRSIYYFIYLFYIISIIRSADLYVDKRPSTDSLTFSTIQGAVDIAEAGDNIIIREGRYSEWVRIMKKRGSYFSPITIKQYPGERVVLDGTVPINTNWETYNHNGILIYRTVVDSASIADYMGEEYRGIWQLFLNDRMMIPAQVINLKNPTDPTTGTASNPEVNTYWEAGGDFIGTDGIYPTNTSNRLEDIDSPQEWCYNSFTREIYFYPPDGLSPNGREIRGRVRDRVLNIGDKGKKTTHIIIEGIEIFASALWMYYANNISFLDCRFAFSTTQKLSGSSAQNSRSITLLGGSPDKENKLWSECDSVVFRNCIFEYIDSEALIIRGSNYGLIENCYFHHINWSGGESVALRTQKAKYTTMRYITIDHNTSGGGFFPSHYNIVDHCLVSNIYSRRDAAGIQVNTGMDEPVIKNTWVMHAPNVNGIRFDGNPGGVKRLIHNTLSINTSRGYRLKGDQHQVHHILGVGSGRADISLPDYKFYGYQNPETGEVSSDPDLGWPKAPETVGFNGLGNKNTVHRNSAANKYECDRPTFLGCDEDQNFEFGLFNGDRRGMENIIYELSNPEHFDYRPRKGSILVDAGVVVEGINDGQAGSRMYVGQAPDIGPYEYGDNVYFIPGYRYPVASFPIPPHNSILVRPATILAWRYPWPSTENTVAEVRVTGPGLNKLESFSYPNNVFSGPFQPGGNYSWNVSVNGQSAGSWFFQVANKIEPDNDRSIINSQNQILYPKQENILTVSNSKTVFLKFTVAAEVNQFWKTKLNLYVDPVSLQGADILVSRFDNIIWHERTTNNNIGIIDRTLGSPIDTLFNIRNDRIVVADISKEVTAQGTYSFALSLLGANGKADFASKENVKGIRPFLSFIPGQNNLEVAPMGPMDDSTLVIEDIPDSIDFSWNLSHHNFSEEMLFELKVQLPYLTNQGTIDSLLLEKEVQGTRISIERDELLDMMIDVGLTEGTFIWSVTGFSDSTIWKSMVSYRLHLVLDGEGSLNNFPTRFSLLHNYPNPFNSNTKIEYELKDWCRVRFDVFDIKGRKIKKLFYGIKPPGRHQTNWYGKNNLGRKVASGVYIIRLTAFNPNTGNIVYSDNEKVMLVN